MCSGVALLYCSDGSDVNEPAPGFFLDGVKFKMIVSLK